VRACRLAGAISRLSATYQQGLLTLQRKRTGGNQPVTVKHIHQQVNVTEGGQAVVAGDTVTRARGSDGGDDRKMNNEPDKDYLTLKRASASRQSILAALGLQGVQKHPGGCDQRNKRYGGPVRNSMFSCWPVSISLR